MKKGILSFGYEEFRGKMPEYLDIASLAVSIQKKRAFRSTLWNLKHKKWHLIRVYYQLFPFLHLLFHSSCQAFLCCYRMKMDSDIQGELLF